MKNQNPQIGAENQKSQAKVISKEDLESLRNIAQVENNLHQRIIKNKYAQVLQQNEDIAISEEVSKINNERGQQNRLLEAKYGQIAKLSLETGEYMTTEDAYHEEMNAQAQAQMFEGAADEPAK